ncbi:MAG: MBL fold metallo-hydrolase [Solirubrobacterales bacterium]|nr:MBL fold metallo-hydrolase [Solirubrobacterales bacterium]
MTTADAPEGPVLELEPGRLAALINLYPVDGRVSWHAPSARGLAPMNCYLLTAGDRALLCDTGLTIHRDALLAQVDAAVPAERELSVLLLRQGEFDAMCNLPPLVKHRPVQTIYGQYADAPEWADIHTAPELRMSDEFPGKPPTIVPENGETIAVDGAGERRLDIFVPALRLLGTYWAFDHQTGTLFSSDSFSYAIRPDASGPWLVTADDDPIAAADVEEHLLGTRYWWLPGADVAAIRADLAAIWDRYDIQRIAPGFGCVLEGRAIAERHWTMVDEIVGRLGRAPGARTTAAAGGSR